ncbi:NADPH-dependent FMN reductase [Thalassobacillus sp. C254]|uniref:NADPH-dependent FMN reductase n=1 Tax=Thalassobacillus sp. C254 TaxID=1225341 RepID=UPI0006D1BF47|nr:NAD(P)H-dependent oxidoreductase [Thalassobacillus sp. C254]
MKLLAISGTIVGSKTGAVLNSVASKIKEQYSEVEVETINLKDFDVEFCDGRDPSAYTGDTRKIIDKITNADCYIIATPIFQASIPGTLKNLFDLLPVEAMKNKGVSVLATSGSYNHYLVMENQLKPILSYFKAYTLPSYVYIHRDHFDEHNEVVDKEMVERLHRFINDSVSFFGAMHTKQ